MGFVKYWAVRSGLAAVIMSMALVAACSSTPTAPTPPPPPPPPVANAPTLSCVEGISRSTVNAAGMTLDFDAPPVTGGQGTVNVTCSPGLRLELPDRHD